MFLFYIVYIKRKITRSVFTSHKVFKWSVFNVRHLGNYMCSNNDDLIDCTRKKSKLIGNVNKLRSNYDNLQHNVLMNLFKSYCCSFMALYCGSFVPKALIKYVNHGMLLIRTLLKQPYNAHTIS